MIRKSVLSVAAVGLLASGCGGDGGAPADLAVQGVLATDPAGNAITYDPASAPEGARLTALVEPGDDTARFTFSATGLLPDRGYAVHAHTQPCGPTGDDAGPHFQHEADPAAGPGNPSVDPAYANPANEVWLDVRTDGQGTGSSEAQVPFGLGDDAPASIIVHEAQATATAPGEAGSAGARLACLALPADTATG